MYVVIFVIWLKFELSLSPTDHIKTSAFTFDNANIVTYEREMIN